MRRTKAEAEGTRQRILDAAERLFFANGVMRTSLEEIAVEAGVTRGAVYWHFDNKVELFKALHERVRLPQEDIVEKAVADGHPDPLGLIEETALDCLATIATDAQRQRVLLARCEYVGEMLEALGRQNEANEQMRAKFMRAFELAHGDGSLGPGWAPEVAAKTFECMMVGLFVDWLRFGQKFDIVEVGRPCIAGLIRSFRAGARAERREPVASPQCVEVSG
jgi:AcrR family transcriptional regulator